ncbi:TPA: copper homeostasis protein CutC [Serratia marcescens]|uniref:PF03932 family protein CutC n=1 Tax=Serratia marcescens TaxID=615 RepID=A0AB33G2D6_SERMA|nr:MULTISPECIES: copper homeostasis protein CutC [Serratia]AKL44293.1 copper homeostasis protein CutC [Serratia marcescens]AWL70939.1 copper homeostasis protein CutC [Serratia marcescens]EIG9089911.1 copper homeostasis protein CutC [Serratia marcescens]MBH2704277.1 copper homeostasis protein CutC [Serratia marcescens]MBH3005427.1 copper homeostasis protein CutC [Serratia marcescens]
MIKLEVCCFSVDCALTAERAGADRIELCASQSEGGLTPSYGTLRLARERVAIPVHPIVRPRGGDFCYGAVDFEVIKQDLRQIREMGFPGVVVGMLDEEGHIDLPRMREVMKLCEGMAVTFHRAFDMCQNPMVALEQLTELGVARILTSGQQQNAELGLPLLRDLRQASHGPVIMAGAGVRLSNLHKFVDIGLHELHSSSGHLVPSTMRYRKAGVTMCSDNEFDEFSHYCVDGEMVEAMKNALALVDPLAQSA